MSAFSRVSRSFRLPQHPLDSSITISMPSDNYTFAPYQPHLPRPPTGELDAPGLRQRIQYGESVGAMHKRCRNISPRLLNFIHMVKDNCKKVLTMKGGKEKREALKILEVEDGMLQSRWEEAHGIDGLCSTLMESMHAMMEVRFQIEYGDYLAHTLSSLKGDGMRNYIWIKEQLDWQAVAVLIDKEEKANKRWRDRRNGPLTTVEGWNEPRPYTPILDDIWEAADKLRLSSEQVVYEIVQYATRNSYCHTGIKRFIDKCQWAELADRILKDKAALNAMYKDRPRSQLSMREAIVRVQNEFFDGCFYNGRELVYAINENAFQRQRARMQRLAANEQVAQPAPADP